MATDTQRNPQIITKRKDRNTELRGLRGEFPKLLLPHFSSFSAPCLSSFIWRLSPHVLTFMCVAVLVSTTLLGGMPGFSALVRVSAESHNSRQLSSLILHLFCVIMASCGMVVSCAPSSMTLYLCVHKDQVDDIVQTQQIQPDRRNTYTGLRHDVQAAYDRANAWYTDLVPADACILAVRFSSLGWLYATTTMRGARPLLERMSYNDGIDWGVWHYNAALPLRSVCGATGAVLHEVKLHHCA
jgi:hypothetical protein